jgi:hypothetical protein
MAILSEEVRQKVEDSLKGLKEATKLVVFTQEFECPICEDNRMQMEELSAISDKKEKIESRGLIRAISLLVLSTHSLRNFRTLLGSFLRRT